MSCILSCSSRRARLKEWHRDRIEDGSYPILDVLRSSVEISEDRYNIAQTKRDLGSGTEFELLLARSDLNTDIAEVLRQEVVVNSAKLDLIRILDRKSVV